MKLRALGSFFFVLFLAGCGSGSASVQNISGLWSCPESNANCLSWSTSSPILGVSSGTTSMTFKLSQGQGADAVTFAAQPTEGNGVAWACPAMTLDGSSMAFGSCALTSGHCNATATPSVTIADGSPMTMSFHAYDYTWTGTGCIGENIKVSIAAFELTRP